MAPDRELPVDCRPAPRTGVAASRSFLLACDAALFVIASYLALRESFFRAAGATSLPRFLLWAIALNVGVAVAAIAEKLGMASGRPHAGLRLARSTGVEVAGFALATQVIPVLVYGAHPPGSAGKIGWGWLLSDWLQLPGEVSAFIATAPLEWVLTMALFAILVRWASVDRRRIPAMGLTAALGCLAARRVAVVTAGENPMLFVLLFVPGPLIVLLGLCLGRVRVATRAGAFAAVATFIGLIYLGDFPLGAARAWTPPPGVTRLYPPEAEHPVYPLRFARDLWIDVPAGRAFLSYGPSSGVVSFDLGSGRLLEHLPGLGTIRKLWSDPTQPFLYGADDVSATLYELEKSPLRVRRTVDLHAQDGIPDALGINGDLARRRLYVLHYDRAAITELDLDSLERRRTFEFFEHGISELRAAVTALEIVHPGGAAYMIVGPVDVSKRWKVLRFDLDRFIVEGSAYVPSGMNVIRYAADRGSVWITSHDTDGYILELDGATLEERRRLPATRFSMALELIPARGWLIPGSPLGLSMPIISAATGLPLADLALGTKVMAIRAIPGQDRVLVASGEGVLSLDLASLIPPRARSETAR